MSSAKTTSEYTYDYIVIGAGLSGLSTADSLIEKNCKVAVIDRKGIASSASGIPVGMVDPAASRNANLYWESENCFNTISENLEKIQSHSSRKFYKVTGVLRPGINEKRGKSLERSFHRQDWPEGWCEWLDESEIKEMTPEVHCEYGGLWHPNSIAVSIPKYLNAYSEYLGKKQVPLHILKDYELSPNNDFWEIKNNDIVLRTQNVIYATGAETSESTFWSELPLHPVKGQVAIYKTEDPLPFSCSISGNGHIGVIDDVTFLIGSTYEHDFTYTHTDEYGRNYLQQKLEESLPSIAPKSQLVRQWAGVRASTPNRLPILGTHRNYSNIHIITGMGSKGLLYSKYTANLLADYLVDHKPLKREIDVERIYHRYRKQGLI